MTVERAAAIERTRSDAALTAFVAEHYDRLLRLARLICRDAGDAADAVQVGLEQAWRRRASLRDERSLRPWLDRIVTREAVRMSKSQVDRLWILDVNGSRLVIDAFDMPSATDAERQELLDVVQSIGFEE